MSRSNEPRRYDLGSSWCEKPAHSIRRRLKSHPTKCQLGSRSTDRPSICRPPRNCGALACEIRCRMFLHILVLQFIRSSLSTSFGAALAIALGIFVQEDITTVAVGIMAADHLISIPLAITSLLVATILNDLAMYGVGRLAHSSPRLRRWVE